ncbi:hypothetical protein C5167_004226 [Papaver somniferum]|nr:hypothetical protein C5167_004226 [Papaver somniferum]
MKFEVMILMIQLGNISDVNENWVKEETTIKSVGNRKVDDQSRVDGQVWFGNGHDPTVQTVSHHMDIIDNVLELSIDFHLKRVCKRVPCYKFAFDVWCYRSAAKNIEVLLNVGDICR